MISFDEALALVTHAASPLGRETVLLADAHRRTLAEPVIAMVDWPPADVSAMDGYAIRSGDSPPWRLVGESFPGTGFGHPVAQGECVRIFTGAPLPDGAGRVVIQEEVRRDGNHVELIAPEPSLGPAIHVRQRGSDFRAGDCLLASGARLTPQALVAAAGADVAEVRIWRRPRVTILGTGDELAAPGCARAHPGGIPESVSYGVGALVADWGGELLGRQRVRDEPALIRRAAGDAVAGSDLLVVTGGASVGDRDYAKTVLAELGLEPIFSKVAIKPGKPVWFGRVGEKLVLGLPGNPTSALVTARLLMAPLLAGLAGNDPAEAMRWQSAPLSQPIGPCGDRETFHRARWKSGQVEPLANPDSGSQKVLAQANLLIRHPADSPAMAAGESVEVLTF